VSKHHLFRAGLGLLAVAAVASVGLVAAQADIFAGLDREAAAPTRGPLECGQPNASISNERWVCLAYNDRPADLGNPLASRPPVHYDYPSYGHGVAGSSLSFIVGAHRRDDLRPPSHAE
jgi:hypothetical protein